MNVSVYLRRLHHNMQGGEQDSEDEDRQTSVGAPF